MKRKNLFMYLIILVCLFVLSSLTACELSNIPGLSDLGDLIPGLNNDKVEDDTNIDNPSDNEGENEDEDGGKEPEVELTLDDLKAAVFEDKTFEYDGETHSLCVSNVPEVVKVTYKNNGKSTPGVYLVQVILEYKDLKLSKLAYLTINRMPSEITAEAEQTVYIYGGDVLPKYEINNDEQEVLFEVYEGENEVSLEKLHMEGVYKVRLYAPASNLYQATETYVTVTVINSAFELKFADDKVTFDGNEHEIVLNGVENLPEGYSVVYSNNKGTEAGYYYAIAEVKDEHGDVIETHAATLTIEYADDPEFNQYLDEFFVWYLEGDQLSVNIICENPANFGLEHYDAKWYTYETITPEDFEHDLGLFNEVLAELREYDDNPLSPLQRVAYRKIEDFVLSNIELYKIENIHLKRLTYIDQFGGYVADFATYMEAYSLRSLAEVEDVLSYINSTPTAFASYLTFIDEKAEAGYALSNYTISEMRNFLKDIIDQGAEYYLADAINAKIDGVDFLSEEEKALYKSSVEEAMDVTFISAVQTLYDGLESRLNKLDTNDQGYWSVYEDGKKIYLLELESLLGINDFNIDEYIATIDNQISYAGDLVYSAQSVLVDKHGIQTYDELEALLERMTIFEGTPEEMMEYLKEFAPTIVKKLNSDPEIYIKEMDAASAAVSNAVAYYMKSPLDNTGTEDITLNPLKLGGANDVLSTLAHEGYPGHLYAYVNSKEIGQHHLNTIMTSTAHAEGWATYVELKLYEYAKANSTNNSLNEVLDYLYANQLMGHLLETRIDVGIHYQGWKVSDCAKYLDGLGYNGDAAGDLYMSIIEMPTTYAAYGYGKIVFVELHNEAKELLGAHYDEVEFNAMLHSRGWTDLGELENTYNEYMRVACHKWGIEYNG